MLIFSSSHFFINFVPVMITFPNAKINIGLDIIRRRPDGYHDLVTAMVPTDWRDVLEIVPASSASSLTVTGRRVDCPVESNLVMKALRLMQRTYGLERVGEMDICLHKVIPDGAGLGGGSADAAFTLRMVNDIARLGATQSQLARLAATLGADCAFFIYNTPMLCTGIGDHLSPLPLSLRGLILAIIKPDAISVNTRQAYSGVTPALPDVPLPDLLALPVDEWQGRVVNAFEASVFPQFPELSRIKSRLLSLGAIYASMSGSGSALYALFDSADNDADKLSVTLSGTFPSCHIHVSQASL